LRQRLYDRKVVFHLRRATSEYIRLVEGFDFVNNAERVEEKLVIGLEDPESQNPLLVKAVEAGAEIQFVGELRRSLEDVYLQLVQ
jgi:ABC-2 type transport system ATP-binding protein